MKEYSIEIINNGGKPYILGSYKDFHSCYTALENLVQQERERGRLYFVDLECFENDYTNYISGKHFRILERNVSNWRKFNYEYYGSSVIKYF